MQGGIETTSQAARHQKGRHHGQGQPQQQGCHPPAQGIPLLSQSPFCRSLGPGPVDLEQRIGLVAHGIGRFHPVGTAQALCLLKAAGTRMVDGLRHQVSVLNHRCTERHKDLALLG